MINLTKMTTLLSLKTDMFQQLQLPSSEWYKTEWKQILLWRVIYINTNKKAYINTNNNASGWYV